MVNTFTQKVFITINKNSMESLFKRHDAYLSKVPMEYVRDFMQHINWNSRLLVIRAQMKTSVGA